MDFGTAVVTLAVGAIAVLPRVPALTATGRGQAHIRRHSELWAMMPHGIARDRLSGDIERRTLELLEEHARDKTVENGWLFGTAWAFLGWVLLIASTAITGEESWTGSIRTALQIAGISTGAVGIFLLALTCALVAWKATLRVYVWFRVRRRPIPLTFDI